MVDEEYRKKLEKFVEEEKKRPPRRESTVIKWNKLQVRMPLGCWVLILLLGFLAYLVLRWILRVNPTILS